MWGLKRCLYRLVQYIVKLAVNSMDFPIQTKVAGPGSLDKLPALVHEAGVTKLLVITGENSSRSSCFWKLLEDLKAEGLRCAVFKIAHDPTISDVQTAFRTYIGGGFEGILAFGGGSKIDCAKAAAALAANSDRPIKSFKGFFKIKKKLPPLFAVPTTSGTGSEATMTAVIKDESNKEKLAIFDTELIPAAAVLDPAVTLELSPMLTALTGIEALTNAVEAYIGRFSTIYTGKRAKNAVCLVFENLKTAYRDGENTKARYNMALASYDAGIAFTRAFAGYVCSISHALGGLYGVQHGLANAVLLPHVLEFYGEKAEKRLSELAVAVGLGKEDDGRATLARRFIQKIKEMNDEFGMPNTIKELKKKDIPLIASRAVSEANPMYPVPRIMSKRECERLLEGLIASPVYNDSQAL